MDRPPPAPAGRPPVRFRASRCSTRPPGLYFLMDATDRTLTATMNEDFMDLWNEDVFEVFLWTDERHPVYFEYQISPLNRELPIIIPNFGGQFLGWRPVALRGEPPDAQEHQHPGRTEGIARSDRGWRAEFFIPYALLRPLQNVPPKAGHRLARQLLPHGPRRRASARSGTGRRSARASTSTRSSAIWCSRIADGDRGIGDRGSGKGDRLMWTRRRFLETASGWPLVGSLVAAGATCPPRTASAATRRTRDYFRDLGVRPFINAAGTYTAMTASLMPPEVMEAINYASRHYVMLDDLHDKVGERIAALIHAEGAMVTSGAAAALTLGTAAVLTGTDRQKIVDLPSLAGMKSEVIVQKRIASATSTPFAIAA